MRNKQQQLGDWKPSQHLIHDIEVNRENLFRDGRSQDRPDRHSSQSGFNKFSKNLAITSKF